MLLQVFPSLVPSPLSVLLLDIIVSSIHSSSLCSDIISSEILPNKTANHHSFLSPHLSSSLVAQVGKSLPAMQETQVQSLGWEDPLEKEMATHSSILAWKTMDGGTW